MTPKKILLCADFSENCERARPVAIEYAKAFGATLQIVNVINTRFLKHPALIDLPVYEDAYKGVETSAKENLNQFAESCKREIPDVQAFLRTGLPGEEIMKLADEQGVDLIVMGTHGRTGLGHLVMGSTAEAVVRKSIIPVMTVKSICL
jgi:universal stress protein A